MATYRFKQVDAFSARPFYGNPLAVVLGADDLDTEMMQRIAAWTNLSETTFVLRPTIAQPAYRLRIFTPGNELPFAGHPTIGSCHAVLDAGVVIPVDGRLVQECGAGHLRLSVREGEGGRTIHVEAPEASFVGEFPKLARTVSVALGSSISEAAPPAAFRNGPSWLFVHLDDRSQLRAVSPNMQAVTVLSREHSLTGVAAFAFAEGEFAVHIRCFAPIVGVPEDPVTGSANAALPAYLVRYGLLGRTGPRYAVTQGTETGRDGRVLVHVLDATGRAEIGGHAVTVVDGELTI